MSNKPKLLKKRLFRNGSIRNAEPMLRFKNPDNGEVLDQYESSEGRYIEFENKEGSTDKVFIDEIIAKMFVPRPEEYDSDWVVLHRNGNINDNSLPNLVWCRPDDPRYIEMLEKINSRDVD